jgi:hypothetical protein
MKRILLKVTFHIEQALLGDCRCYCWLQTSDLNPKSRARQTSSNCKPNHDRSASKRNHGGSESLNENSFP